MRGFLIRIYVWLSWLLFFGGIVGWPLSQLTIAKNEPPFILGLSWLAIVISALGVIVSAEVRQEQHDDD